MGKILAVYNTCGISGVENAVYYIDAIRSVLLQRGFGPEEVRLVLSSCMNTDLVHGNLKTYFGDSISYNWIYESLPLTVTFNHTVMESVKNLGAFDSYLYIDSGINFWDPGGRWDTLKTMYDIHKSGPYAMCSAFPSNDDGREWWHIDYEEDKEFIFPVGKTTNLHCQLYSEELRQAYDGRLHCDIFQNDSSESLSTFLCAAIKKNMVMCPASKVHLLHNQSMDGASIGWRGQNPDGTVKLFKTDKTMEERFHEGYEFGFGYEECKPRWLHDDEKFDEHGWAKDERLLDFLRKECFLKPSEFSYENIVSQFEP